MRISLERVEGDKDSGVGITNMGAGGSQGHAEEHGESGCVARGRRGEIIY
jgi:hypothetical protein